MEKLYELFIEYMDSIYYAGYTKQIASENPELFTFEWREFIRIHEPKPEKVISGDFKRQGAKIIKLHAAFPIVKRRA